MEEFGVRWHSGSVMPFSFWVVTVTLDNPVRFTWMQIYFDLTCLKERWLFLLKDYRQLALYNQYGMLQTEACCEADSSIIPSVFHSKYTLCALQWAEHPFLFAPLSSWLGLLSQSSFRSWTSPLSQCPLWKGSVLFPILSPRPAWWYTFPVCCPAWT